MKDVDLYKQWLTAVEQHDFQTAYNLYRKMLALDSDWVKINYPMGIWFEEKGMYPEAITALERALKTDPGLSADIYFHLANIYRKEKKFEQAQVLYEKAITTDPTFFEAYYNLGKVLSELGKKEEALSVLQKALNLNPQDLETYINIGVELSNLGRKQEAIKIYEKALEIDSHSAMLYSNLGVEYTALGQLEKAITLHKQALAINNFYGDGWYNLACAYSLNQQQAKALDALKKAIKIDRENIDYALQDPELVNIKNTQEFNELINNNLIQ